MTATTVFAHHKGGTGKTTACINVAGALQQAGERVLVVDADPQANATRNLGLNVDLLDTGLADLLTDGTATYKDCIYPTQVGIDLLPGGLALHDAYRDRGSDRHHQYLDTVLDQVKGRYTQILIDAPSAPITAIAAGIRAADHFHLVMDGSIFSRDGVRAVKTFLTQLPDRHSLVMNPDRVLYVENGIPSLKERLVSMVLGTSTRERMKRKARNAFGTRFVTVPYCPNVYRSQEDGKPLSHLDVNSPAAAVFADIAADLQR